MQDVKGVLNGVNFELRLEPVVEDSKFEFELRRLLRLHSGATQSEILNALKVFREQVDDLAAAINSPMAASFQFLTKLAIEHREKALKYEQIRGIVKE